jgi:predicted GIY-YIG superfamily endonuclease
MGFIYKIEIDNQIYIGSTLNLRRRQTTHNNDLNIKKTTGRLYEKCRECNITDINLILLEEVEDNDTKIKEQEYIDKLKPTLNMIRAIPKTKEQQKLYKKKWRSDNKHKNNVKINCDICGEEMNKSSLYRHKKRKHN